jgi:hypothetical protein
VKQPVERRSIPRSADSPRRAFERLVALRRKASIVCSAGIRAQEVHGVQSGGVLGIGHGVRLDCDRGTALIERGNA